MTDHTRAALPLSRYTVLDLTIARAGPTAVRLLADWGARVIRVEPPPQKDRGSITGRRRGPDEQNLHRNKRGLCLDLKSAHGAQVLRRLIERSDVVVENFRAEVKERLGLTYEQLKKINPRIILASISGFGQDGPYSERPGFLGQGILLALLHREHTGEGQWVHTSLLEGMLNKLDFQGARYTVDGVVPGREGNAHPTQVPMGTYQASDGLVNIAASTQKNWISLC